MVFLYFCTFCTFSFSWTVHMNFHAKSGVCSSKNNEYFCTYVLFLHFLYFCTFVIYLDYPYELPCKIWCLYLKKWLTYCSRYERGHFYISSLSIYLQLIIQSKLVCAKVRKFGQLRPRHMTNIYTNMTHDCRGLVMFIFPYFEL